MKLIKCDICSEILDDTILDYCTINHNFGYGTEYEEQSFHIDVCEHCLIKLFKNYIGKN